MKWLVVIPTIRQDRAGFEEVMSRIRASFTQPTEFHILDGNVGKAQALNEALKTLLADHDFYVTMDDDYVPGSGWQDVVSQAFEDVPNLGLASLWVGDDPELQAIAGAQRIGPPKIAGGTTYRLVERGHHILGACHVYPAEVARQLGPQPETKEKLQIWEDAWRGRRVQSLGFDLAFIEGSLPEFVIYEDPAEYAVWRAEQTTLSRRDQGKWLKDSGIPDPISLRFRRWFARLRGKA